MPRAHVSALLTFLERLDLRIERAVLLVDLVDLGLDFLQLVAGWSFFLRTRQHAHTRCTHVHVPLRQRTLLQLLGCGDDFVDHVDWRVTTSLRLAAQSGAALSSANFYVSTAHQRRHTNDTPRRKSAVATRTVPSTNARQTTAVLATVAAATITRRSARAARKRRLLAKCAVLSREANDAQQKQMHAHKNTKQA